MNWNQHRILVTGATGIVGSWVVKRLLAEKASVVCFIRDWDPRSELIRSGDVFKTTVVNGRLEHFPDVERAVNEHEIDTVIHLGAQTIVGTAFRNPWPTLEANIRGAYNLLEACRLHRDLVRRIVVASSDKAYGHPQTLPYTEDMPLVGRHPYDVSKSCADLLAAMYAETYGMPIAVARCGNIYGGGDLNWSRIVPGTIRSAHFGQRPVLRSDGRFIRDYIFVADIVEAYLRLAEHAERPDVRGHAFNFSPQSRVSVLDITNLILRIMERPDLEPVILDNAQGEIRDQYLDASKARRILQWTPAHSLDDGLLRTVAWYREFFAHPAATAAFQPLPAPPNPNP